MSEMTPTETTANALPSQRNLKPLGLEIDERVKALQRGYLSNCARARAQVAQLRHGIGRPPGSVPAIWDLTVADLPGTPSDTSAAPTREENAAHAALTLYAVHQQSRTEPMHRPGIGFGSAVRALAGPGADQESTVRRRFDAVATATSFEEALHHLRGLVRQLRSANVGLDYGQLADDLLLLQVPSQIARVRLRWARLYYRTATATASTDKDA